MQSSTNYSTKYSNRTLTFSFSDFFFTFFIFFSHYFFLSWFISIFLTDDIPSFFYFFVVYFFRSHQYENEHESTAFRSKHFSTRFFLSVTRQHITAVCDTYVTHTRFGNCIWDGFDTKKSTNERTRSIKKWWSTVTRFVDQKWYTWLNSQYISNECIEQSSKWSTKYSWRM